MRKKQCDKCKDVKGSKKYDKLIASHEKTVKKYEKK